MRREVGAAGHLIVVAAASVLLAGCNETAELPVADTRVSVSSARPGEHIVIIASSSGSDESRASIGYLVDEISSRGMGTVVLPEQPAGESVADTVAETVGGLQQDTSTAAHPVTLLAVGHGYQDVWQVIADPPQGLVASVTINVPAVPGLDFSDGLTVATLSLNLESDELATNSHHEVHEAMAAAGTLHQVIVYGKVKADALDQGSADWDEPTADDVANRAADWLQHRDGFTNQNMENPGDHL